MKKKPLKAPQGRTKSAGTNRAARRAISKKGEKANKALAQKISSFEHRPDACTTCKAPFDAKSKEHALTWRVIVHKNPPRVILTCPTCDQKIKETLDAYAKNNNL